MINKIKEKGITIIALVVTIIILLILVGVTISQITGENGLFRRAMESVEKYKLAQEDEEQSLEQLGQYLSDFSIVGGDNTGNEVENGGKASVKIIGLEVKNIELKTIKVTVKVEGEDINKIEYSINNGDSWEKDEENIKSTEYTYKELKLGQGYFVRVRVYDNNENYVEAISKVIMLNIITTAKEKDVLNGRTFESNGTIKTGTMTEIGDINQTLDAGKSKIVPAGYTSGGTISAKSLAEQTHGTATADDIAEGKTAWIDGKEVEGLMKEFELSQDSLVC